MFACGLQINGKTLLCIFFVGLCFVLEKKRMQKTKFFLAACLLRSFVRTGNKRNLLFQSNEAWLFAACKSLRCYNEVIEIHFDYRSFFSGQRD